ncbi:hypothetical protein Tco_1350244, partial [Tanacetum coccineum]
TDISKITRKPPKTSKHGHGKRKSTKEAKDSEAKPRKVNSQSTLVNLSQLWAKKSQLTKGQIPNVSFQSLQVSNVTQMVLEP